jgi:YidC/Oxa1 family membrane protein insertase
MPGENDKNFIMDRNTFTGLFLILIIIVASTYLLKPSGEEINREKQLQDSIAAAASGKSNPISNTDTSKNITQIQTDTASFKGPFAAARVGNNHLVTLENEHLKVNISTKGGRIESVQLKTAEDKKVTTYDGKPLFMFEGAGNKFGLIFHAASDSISTNDLYFTPSGSSVNVLKNDSTALTMRLTYADGKYIDYVYTLKSGSYKVGFTIITKGMGDVIAGGDSPLVLNWQAVLKQKEKDLEAERTRYSTVYYKLAADDANSLSTTKNESLDIGGAEGKIQWISFKQHFFSNVLISKNGFNKATVLVANATSPGVVKSYAAKMQLPFSRQDVSTYPMEFYFGPNKYSILNHQDDDLNDHNYNLEQQINMGYFPLKYINKYVVLPVFNFLESFGLTYGLIILLLTIFLKVVLSPLTYKSYLSMAKMKVLKPEIDEIKAKIGEDNPMLLQQESMKLYKKAGVNPLGGCVPMLLQMPIILAFFFFFPSLYELRGESFLWVNDLSTYDEFVKFGFNIPFIGNHLSLMCVLMTVSTLIYTYFNNQISGVTGQMKYIGYITPIIFLGVLNSYPAGLNYYYFLANMLTFAQQFAIRQMVNDEKIHAQIQEHKKKPVSQKKSKFQQRMDDYMRSKQSAVKDQPKLAGQSKKKK